MSANLRRLGDGKSYKVFASDCGWFDRWITGIRYWVTTPDGLLLRGTRSRAGALLVIRRDQRKPPRVKWWDRPIVHEEPVEERSPRC